MNSSTTNSESKRLKFETSDNVLQKVVLPASSESDRQARVTNNVAKSNDNKENDSSKRYIIFTRVSYRYIEFLICYNSSCLLFLLLEMWIQAPQILRVTDCSSLRLVRISHKRYKKPMCILDLTRFLVTFFLMLY